MAQRWLTGASRLPTLQGGKVALRCCVRTQTATGVYCGVWIGETVLQMAMNMALSGRKVWFEVCCRKGKREDERLDHVSTDSKLQNAGIGPTLTSSLFLTPEPLLQCLVPLTIAGYP